MQTISKEILLMMYKNVNELSFDNKTTYWCTDGEKCDIIIFCNNDTGKTVQYDNIIKYSTRKNISFIELKDKAIIFDLNTLSEVATYEISMRCSYIYDEAVAIPMKDRVVVYSLLQNKELFNEECKCTAGSSYNAKGRVYDFINFNTAALLVKRDGTVGKLIKANKGMKLSCSSDKSVFCDMIVTQSQSSYFVDNIDFGQTVFVCGTSIFDLDDYMDYITIESIELVETDVTNKDLFEQKKYDVVLKNGQKGRMSHDLRRLRINDKGSNILNTNFEYYKKQYLKN